VNTSICHNFLDPQSEEAEEAVRIYLKQNSSKKRQQDDHSQDVVDARCGISSVWWVCEGSRRTGTCGK
jgi:hypothetical protein